MVLGGTMADRDITTRYGLDVSDLKKGLDEAKQAIRLANATFKAETAGLDDWASSADGVRSKLAQLDKVLEAQQSQLDIYKKQLENANNESEKSARRAEELRAKLQELADDGVSKTSDEYKEYERQLQYAESAQERNEKKAQNLTIQIKNQEAQVASTQRK